MAFHADISPQNVHKSFFAVAQHKLTFLARTPDIEDLLKEGQKLINNLLKSPSRLQ